MIYELWYEELNHAKFVSKVFKNKLFCVCVQFSLFDFVMLELLLHALYFMTIHISWCQK